MFGRLLDWLLAWVPVDMWDVDWDTDDDCCDDCPICELDGQ